MGCHQEMTLLFRSLCNITIILLNTLLILTIRPKILTYVLPTKTNNHILLTI